MRKSLLALVAVSVLTALLSACVAVRPTLVPEHTLNVEEKKVSATPEVLSTPEAEPVIEPSAVPATEPTHSEETSFFDAMGALIEENDHYKRYVSFKDIQVYEQCDDTFMDAVAINEYAEPVECALDIVFYEDDEEVARGKLQTRDGMYVLILEPGETTVFSQIDTDMTLTDIEFELVFDESLGVRPQ